MAYPIDGSTGVSTSVGTLLYVDDSATVPIQLAQPDGALVRTEPTPLPSPLPSPIAPFYGNPTLFARAISTLQPTTKYNVEAYYTYDACYGPCCNFPAGNGYTYVGSFTTQ